MTGEGEGQREEGRGRDEKGRGRGEEGPGKRTGLIKALRLRKTE